MYRDLLEIDMRF